MYELSLSARHVPAHGWQIQGVGVVAENLFGDGGFALTSAPGFWSLLLRGSAWTPGSAIQLLSLSSSCTLPRKGSKDLRLSWLTLAEGTLDEKTDLRIFASRANVWQIWGSKFGLNLHRQEKLVNLHICYTRICAQMLSKCKDLMQIFFIFATCTNLQHFNKFA